MTFFALDFVHRVGENLIRFFDNHFGLLCFDRNVLMIAQLSEMGSVYGPIHYKRSKTVCNIKRLAKGLEEQY